MLHPLSYTSQGWTSLCKQWGLQEWFEHRPDVISFANKQLAQECTSSTEEAFRGGVGVGVSAGLGPPGQ